MTEVYPNVNRKTIQWRIHELKKRGIIHHISRGVYSFTEKHNYSPSISPALKRLYSKIHKGLPYAMICVWDTRWFNEFMELQMFKTYMVIEAEKEVAEAVHNRLVGPSISVYLDPGKELFEKYIPYQEHVIIVKSMISESPTMEINGIVCATLEKLLVDCLADPLMFSAQQGEVDSIYRNAFSKYSININAMKRYASRRNRQLELEKEFKTMAKNGINAADLNDK